VRDGPRYAFALVAQVFRPAQLFAASPETGARLAAERAHRIHLPFAPGGSAHSEVRFFQVSREGARYEHGATCTGM